MSYEADEDGSDEPLRWPRQPDSTPRWFRGIRLLSDEEIERRENPNARKPRDLYPWLKPSRRTTCR
jgi:hypothetical protein